MSILDGLRKRLNELEIKHNLDPELFYHVKLEIYAHVDLDILRPFLEEKGAEEISEENK